MNKINLNLNEGRKHGSYDIFTGLVDFQTHLKIRQELSISGTNRIIFNLTDKILIKVWLENYNGSK